MDIAEGKRKGFNMEEIRQIGRSHVVQGYESVKKLEFNPKNNGSDLTSHSSSTSSTMTSSMQGRYG